MITKKIYKICFMILRHYVISISLSISYCLGMFAEKISDTFVLRKINEYIKNLKMAKFHIWKLLLAKIMSLLFWKILWKIIICWIIKRVYLLSMIEYQNLNAIVHIFLEVLKVNMSYKNTLSSFLQLLATKKYYLFIVRSGTKYEQHQFNKNKNAKLQIWRKTNKLRFKMI